MMALRQKDYDALLMTAMGVIVLFIALLLSGCAGPSKARYAELLHECRVSNRAHLRLVKEYDEMDCKTRPSQGFGEVESNLAGFK